MKQFYFLSIASFAIVISGCGSTQSVINLDECKKAGNFCYKGSNYGKDRGSEFQKGVRDGCTTGEGEFRKNYSLSSSSKNYFDGWMLGRSNCKQTLPNEGTRREEYNSKLRAQYQINQLRLKQNTSTRTIQEKVDTLLDDSQESQVAEIEY